MRRLAVSLLLLVALLVVGWVILGLGSEPGDPALDAGDPRPDGSEGRVVLEGRPEGAATSRAREGAVDLRGRVVDDAGRGLGEVSVELREALPYVRGPDLWQRAAASEALAGEVVEVARTSADGSFQLAHARPRARYAVSALPTAPDVGERVVLEVGDDPPADLRLRVWHGAGLRLRVVDEEGAGLVAFVRGRSVPASSRLEASPVWEFDERATDAQGRLRIAAVPPGRLRLDVRVPGRGARRDLDVGVSSAEEIVIPFGAEGDAIVSGSVKDPAGRAVLGARVLLVVRTGLRSSAGARREERVTASADDGGWRVDGLPAAELERVTVTAQEYVYSDRRFLGLPLEAGREVRVDVTLRAATTITGRITTPDGKPLSGVRMIFKDPAGTWTCLATARTATDSAGRFRVESVPPGVIVLAPWTVQAPGYHLPEQVELHVTPDGGPIQKDIVLHPGLAVTGRVVDVEDRPVAGVTVVAHGPPERRDQPLVPYAPSTVTRSDGTFAFEGLDPGGGWVFDVLESEWVVLPPLPWLFLRASDGDTHVTLRVGPPARVTGRVVDGDGVGVARWRVKLTVGNLARETASDALGRFVFDGIPAGTAWIGPSHEGEAPGVTPLDIDVAWGQQIDDVLLRVPRAFTVAGRILDRGGTPLAGLSFSIAPDMESPPRSWGTRTDASGHFVRADLPAGTYRAWIRGSAVGLPFEAGARRVHLVYDLPERRVLEGRVLRPDGTPVPSGSVRSDVQGAGRAAILDGTFRVPFEAQVEKVRLKVVSAMDAVGEPLSVCAPARIEVKPHEGPIEIRLLPGLEVAGRVLDPVGQGVEGVTLKIPEAPGMLASRQTLTDARGRFSFQGVPAGVVTLKVDAGSAWPDPTPVEIEAGRTDVVVRLEASGVLEGIVVTPEGRPVEGALVHTSWSAKGIPGEARQAPTNAEGRFRLSGVPIVPLPLFVSSPRDERGESWPWLVAHLRKVTPPQPDLRIVLEPGVWIRGRVVGPEGKRLSKTRVHVVAVPVDGPDTSPRCDYPNPGDESFGVGPLPFGPVRLRAFVNTPEFGVSSAVIVRPPTQDVELVVKRSWAFIGRVYGEDVGGFVVDWHRQRGSAWEHSSTVVDAAGYFAIEDLPDLGRGMIFVHRDGDDRVAFQVADPASIAHVIPVPGRTVHGRVEAPDEVEVAGIVVEVYDECGIGGRGVVDAQGRLEIPRLPRGVALKVRVVAGLPRGYRAIPEGDVAPHGEELRIQLTRR